MVGVARAAGRRRLSPVVMGLRRIFANALHDDKRRKFRSG
jgi:hypothetical protein